jgi:eukaryotic-like serine/threonine-protein kinase
VFFAMEYLDGHDLASELDRGQLQWPRIKSISLQICAALQAAHEAGVIHRDLKPENIYLIERLGNPDYVKVLDFGVAKLTEIEEAAKERRLTRTGMVFGTPEYMSPEQARGEKPDTRVDVYASGCILFEMVTGDVPFRADNFMGVLTKHLFDPLPMVAERSTRTDLPPGLQEVISQALAKDKNQRFSSMNELAVAIDTLDHTEGVAYTAGNERSRRYPKPEAARRAPTDSEREKKDAAARRAAVARAKTTPAPTTDEDLTARQPMAEPSLVAGEADTHRPRRRGRWAVLGAALALALAAGGVIAWQIVGASAPLQPAAEPTSAAPTPTPPPTPTAPPLPTPPPSPNPTLSPNPTPPPPTDLAAPAEPQKAATEPQNPAADPQKTPKPAVPPADPKKNKRPDRHRPAPTMGGGRPAAASPSPTTTPELPGPEPTPKPEEPKSDLKDPFGGK